MPIKDKSGSLESHRAIARDLAIKALSFLAADPERLVRFLGETGLTPTTLREAASQKDFASGILTYILSDEALLVAFSQSEGLEPKHVAGAHAILSPGFDPDEPVHRPM